MVQWPPCVYPCSPTSNSKHQSYYSQLNTHPNPMAFYCNGIKHIQFSQAFPICPQHLMLSFPFFHQNLHTRLVHAISSTWNDWPPCHHSLAIHIAGSFLSFGSQIKCHLFRATFSNTLLFRIRFCLLIPVIIGVCFLHRIYHNLRLLIYYLFLLSFFCMESSVSILITISSPAPQTEFSMQYSQ